ncbi:hypothetical protein JTB14_000007 [Gonioctena quinquepunctata]|nr:hypothetical protein JTB14_000007 [Gonioctena quinquepunctata]
MESSDSIGELAGMTPLSESLLQLPLSNGENVSSDDTVGHDVCEDPGGTAEYGIREGSGDTVEYDVCASIGVLKLVYRKLAITGYCCGCR